MSNSMLNSKEFLFFGLLLFVFLSSQVLAHHEESNANHLSDYDNEDNLGDDAKKTIGGTLFSSKTIPRYQYAKKTIGGTKHIGGDGSPIDDEEDDGEKNSHELLVSKKILPSTRYEYNAQSTRHNPSKLSHIGGGPFEEEDGDREGDGPYSLVPKNILPSSRYEYSQLFTHNPSKLSHIGEIY
ncbi:PREDICTED: uncharacterized protein LOC109325434 [Lupinus angustifolius]|uniref:uncharacterized protein LOC109325434 n=1 Tax=Lupinus angustifolius TaxID=3871 RepID=UPI00092E3E55|nr:PREDICTED: uncharacterized protein LOC109325434 [Lupinus angustifolius]